MNGFEADDIIVALQRQVYAEMAAAETASVALSTECTDRLHRAVHADFLTMSRLPPPQPQEPSDVWCTAQLPEDVYWRSLAIHETAHAVLSAMLGLTVLRLTLARDRALAGGGNAVVQGPGDAQHFAVELIGASYAQAIWLRGNGYTHSELARCVLMANASPDQAAVHRLVGDGFVVDRGRAVADALRLLSMPMTMNVIEAVATQLENKHVLSGQEVADIANQHNLARPPASAVWTPSRQNTAATRLSSDRAVADQILPDYRIFLPPDQAPGSSSRLRHILNLLAAGRSGRARPPGPTPERSAPPPQTGQHDPAQRQSNAPQQTDHGRGYS